MGKNKKEVTTERKDYLDLLHKEIDNFRIKANNEWVYLKFQQWVGYSISILVLSCDKIIDYHKTNNFNLSMVVDKLRKLFVDRIDYETFTMKNLTDKQIRYLICLLSELECELGNPVMESIYYPIFKKIIYIRRLLSCQQDIRYLEKKHMDSISRARIKIGDVIKSNHWDGFLTVTFDENKFDRFDTDLQLNALREYFDDLKMNIHHDLQYLILPDLHYKKNNGKAIVDEEGHYASHFHCLIKNIDNIDQLLVKLKTENNDDYLDKDNRQVYCIKELNEKFGYSYFTYCDDNMEGLCIYFMNHINLKNDSHRRVKKRYYTSQYLNKCKKETLYVTKEEKKSMIRKELKNKLNKITKKVVTFKERSFHQVVEIYKFKKINRNKSMIPFVIRYENSYYKSCIDYNIFYENLVDLYNKLTGNKVINQKF
ncbi:MAG: hypothetical protein ACERKV_06750 [Clostridiaceae bacterium]